ncbi:MAG TPA: HEPN-associated N-terminal domain-containing protein [Solirubrobacterales bacterium]|nr:HEPN-associated N-terminal domain-containing protein [Solirubrobacterales bacterium]
MGWAKELENEQYERRAAGVSGYVCDECFSDPALIAYVKENATENECDFCGRKDEAPIAAEADGVVALIMESIGTEWTDPVDELAYETAEGGYQGQQIEFDQVLYEVGEPIEGDEFREALTAATAGYTVQWCKRDYAAPFEDEAMEYDWDDLVDLVKFKSRFFFSTQVREEREPGQRKSAVDILGDIWASPSRRDYSGRSRRENAPGGAVRPMSPTPSTLRRSSGPRHPTMRSPPTG